MSLFGAAGDIEDLRYLGLTASIFNVTAWMAAVKWLHGASKAGVYAVEVLVGLS